MNWEVSSPILWKGLCKTSVSSSLNAWILLDLEISFSRAFKLWIQFVIGLFISSISSWLALVVSGFLRNWSIFFQGIKFVCIKLFVFIYYAFTDYRICNDILYFVPDISNLSFLFLFLSILLEVYQFYWYFWRTIFLFRWSLYIIFLI